MKGLIDYIFEKQENEFIDQMINEGFWEKLGNLLGRGVKSIEKAMSNFSKGFNDALTATNVVAAKTKDKESKKLANELLDEIDKAKDEKDAIKALKAHAERVILELGEKGNISHPDYAIALKYSLKEVKNDKECQELADKLDKAIQAKFGDTEKTEKSFDLIVNKIKKSDVVPDGNEEDSKEDKKEDTVEKV